MAKRKKSNLTGPCIPALHFMHPEGFMQTITFILRLLALLACLTGLCLNMGVPQGRLHLTQLNYYTILSNILCLAFWGALLLGVRPSAAVRGAVAMSILLTMVVYHFMLAGSHAYVLEESFSYMRAANWLVHYITPTLMVLDFLLLGERESIGALAPVCWTVVPLCYLIFALIRGLSGVPIGGMNSAYAYFFIDPAQGMILKAPQGYAGVALNSLLISVVYIAAGYGLRGVYGLLGTVLSR